MEMNNSKTHITLVIGENGSGKSLFAEDLAVNSSKSRIYLATMIPQNRENDLRIEKHRIQRRDKGFVTYEQNWNIDQLDIPYDSVVLLEDVSNLLANGIFIHHQTVSDTFTQILRLASKCKLLIAVNISGLSNKGYDEETTSYINGINLINEKLREVSDTVYLMKDGRAVRIKPSSDTGEK